MTCPELLAMLPLIVLGAAAVLILLLLAFYRHHALTAGITLLALAASLVLLLTVVPREAGCGGPLLRMDGQAVFFGGLVIASAFFCTLLAAGYLPTRQVVKEEFYVLLLLATLGAATLTASVHLASFFLSLELLSVSLYSLIAYERSGLGVEAGIKYLVLAGTSSAMLLFGLAVIYAFAGYDNNPGTMDMLKLGGYFASGDQVLGAGQYLKHFLPMLAGLALVLAGVGFKLALVPFHLWTPDVYQGAPPPVTAFIATASKGAVFALLLRYSSLLGVQSNAALHLVLFVVAVASMAAGNLLALWQHDLRRVLAYSSIANMGYVLVALLASGTEAGARMGGQAVAFYLTAYFVTTLGAFGVVSMLESGNAAAKDGGRAIPNRGEEYRGLFFRRPATAVILAMMLLSLAGLPLTAGFMGKFLVLQAGMAGGQLALTLVLIGTSGIGLCYYLRITLAMFDRGGEPTESGTDTDFADEIGLSPRFCPRVAIWTMALLLIAIGVQPDPLLQLISRLMP
jgi:NADH-quinone oxidoreductase subunit N